MCAQTTASLIQPVLSIAGVVVGGALAVLGGWLGARWNHKLTLEREERKDREQRLNAERSLRRDKLQHLVELVLETERSLEERGTKTAELGICQSMGRLMDERPARSENRLDEVDAIQSLFFPELLEEEQNLRSAWMVHSNFLNTQIDLIAKNAQQWALEQQPIFSTQHVEALKPFMLAKRALLRKAHAIAQATFLATA
jgi:hypothetical protein